MEALAGNKRLSPQLAALVGWGRAYGPHRHTVRFQQVRWCGPFLSLQQRARITYLFSERGFCSSCFAYSLGRKRDQAPFLATDSY